MSAKLRETYHSGSLNTEVFQPELAVTSLPPLTLPFALIPNYTITLFILKTLIFYFDLDTPLTSLLSNLFTSNNFLLNLTLTRLPVLSMCLIKWTAFTFAIWLLPFLYFPAHDFFVSFFPYLLSFTMSLLLIFFAFLSINFPLSFFTKCSYWNPPSLSSLAIPPSPSMSPQMSSTTHLRLSYLCSYSPLPLFAPPPPLYPC